MAKNQNSVTNGKNKKPIAVLRKGVVTAALGISMLAGGVLLSGCTGDASAKWHYGTEDPTSAIGKVGDFYFETDDSDVWVYEEDGWKILSNLKGDQGLTGAQGVSVTSIAKTSSEGLVDTYTITYSNNTTSTFTVTNGAQGIQGIQGNPGGNGHTPVITIQGGFWYVDNVNTQVSAVGIQGDPGRGISNIELTSTNDLVDTYTITYSNNTTSTFTVTNGAQGIQGIQGVPGNDGHTPVITIENGKWVIDGVDTGKAVQGEKGETGKTGFFVYDQYELKTALEIDNTYLVLMSDIYLYEQLDVTNRTVINLNGHSIYCNSDIWNESTKSWSALSVNGGSLTLKGDGLIQTNYGDCYALDVRNGGNLVIEGGHYIGNVSAVYALEGNVTIYGGTYEIQQLSAYDDYRYLLNCYDQNYKAGTANFTVYGGKYYGFNPAENTAENFATGQSFMAEARQSIEYEDHGIYKVYKVVDPQDTSIESYYLNSQSIALNVKSGEVVESFDNYTLTIERANGQKEDIKLSDTTIDLSGYRTSGEMFNAPLTYETIETYLNILPIENVASLANNGYEISASLNGQRVNLLCEKGSTVEFNTALDYTLYNYNEELCFTYSTTVTSDMLVDFDNTAVGLNEYSLDTTKVGCYVEESLSVLVYDPQTAEIYYSANEEFKVGEGSYDKISVTKFVRVSENEFGSKVISLTNDLLNGQTIDFNTPGNYTISSQNVQISVTVYDPEVCNISYISFNQDYDDLQILKGSTQQEIETFISNYILTGYLGKATGTAYFLSEVNGVYSESFELTRSMIDLTGFDINKVGEQSIKVKYTQQAGYVAGKTVAYEGEIEITVYVDMAQANPVGDPFDVASSSMIAQTMGYTSIQLYDNGCAYMQTRYSNDPRLVEYTTTQIGETNTYIYKFFETNANGYIYFTLTEDAQNGNSFDCYLPSGTVGNTYTTTVEGMPLTINVYGTEGTCYAACYVNMGQLIHYVTVDFTYNQDGTFEVMGVTYVSDADNVLTPQA